MTVDDMLHELAAGFANLLGRFVTAGSNSVLVMEDAAQFRQLCLEAKGLLNHHLGENEYSSQLTAASTRDWALPGRGPSFESVVIAQSVVLAAANTIGRQAQLAASNKPTAKVDPYASDARVAELRAIVSPDWDLTRLVRLCEELNTAHETGSLMSTAMLVRSIMDHVPPIFGAADFNSAANNYAWPGRSIRNSMQNLQNSLRNVADAHLHLHIRQREVLPTAPQVDFKADLDVLLGEVVRALKR